MGKSMGNDDATPAATLLVRQHATDRIDDGDGHDSTPTQANHSESSAVTMRS